MKVKRMRNGYTLRLNDSEFAALKYVVDGYNNGGAGPAVGAVKRGLNTLDLEVTDDRRVENKPIPDDDDPF